MLSVNLLAVNYKLLIVNCKLSLAALHADGRSNGGKYCDDKIDGFFSHGLMIYKNLIYKNLFQLKMFITREIS